MTLACSLAAGDVLDLEAVMQVMSAAFDPAYGEAWTRAQCAGILSLPGVWLSLAQAGEDVAGFALARAVADEAELLLLAVNPSVRRAGIGRTLLDEVIARARRHGALRLHLEMRADNPARSLYEAAGFVEVGRRARYYRGCDGQSRDAITLSRGLDPADMTQS